MFKLAESLISKVVKGIAPIKIIEEYNEYAVDNLDNFIRNNKPANDRLWMMYKNLTVKKAQGKYNSELAPKLFMYLIKDAVKSMYKEWGSDGAMQVTKEDMQQAAKAYVDEFESMHDTGELDDFIPKKYRGK